MPTEGATELRATNVYIDVGVVASAVGTHTQTDMGRLAVDFAQQILIFVVQRVAIAGEGIGGGLRRQSLQTIQNLRNVVKAAVDDLERGETVVRVANALHQFAYFAADTCSRHRVRRRRRPTG